MDRLLFLTLIKRRRVTASNPWIDQRNSPAPIFDRVGEIATIPERSIKTKIKRTPDS